MKISEFKIGEMLSNSQGKTSCALVCALLLVITGCTMGLRGAFFAQADSMLQGLAFAGLGTGLLGIRRWTNDKPISKDATPS